MKILLIAGARPNFMKIAPIVRRLKAQPPSPKGYGEPGGAPVKQAAPQLNRKRRFNPS